MDYKLKYLKYKKKYLLLKKQLGGAPVAEEKVKPIPKPRPRPKQRIEPPTPLGVVLPLPRPVKKPPKAIRRPKIVKENQSQLPSEDEIKYFNEFGRLIPGVLPPIDFDQYSVKINNVSWDTINNLYLNQGDYSICWMVASICMLAFINIINFSPEIDNFIFRTFRMFKNGKQTNCPLLPKIIDKYFQMNYIIKLKIFEILKGIDDKKKLEFKVKNEENIYTANSTFMKKNIFPYFTEKSNYLIYNNSELIKILKLYKFLFDIDSNRFFYIEMIDDGLDPVIFVESILKASGYAVFKKELIIGSNFNEIRSFEYLKNLNNIYLEYINDEDKSIFPLEKNDSDMEKRKTILENYKDKNEILNELYNFNLSNKKICYYRFSNFEKYIINIDKIDTLLNDLQLNTCTISVNLTKIDKTTGKIISSGNHELCIIRCSEGEGRELLYCNSWEGSGCKLLKNIYEDPHLTKHGEVKILAITFLVPYEQQERYISKQIDIDRSKIFEELKQYLE